MSEHDTGECCGKFVSGHINDKDCPLAALKARVKELEADVAHFKKLAAEDAAVFHCKRAEKAEAVAEQLRAALASEAPCTCRPHGLGQDKPYRCLRCITLSITASAGEGGDNG